VRLRAAIAASLALALAAPSAAEQTSPGLAARNAAIDLPMAPPKGARLVWHDEFDHPGAPDPAKWRYDTAFNRQGWFNGEKQYYAADRPQNARVEDGKLIITARHERLTDEPDYGGEDYSSARLDTKGLAQWTYGFVEVRAKLPCGKGTWPAIWMLGADDAAGWPAQGEIDIMEQVGWQPHVIHGTIHTKAFNHVLGTQVGSQTTVPSSCEAFHRYELDWTPQRILIGVDGRAYMRFTNAGSGDRARWPFGSPQYLILNLAIGGWGGEQGIDDGALPATMAVDYVRIWQRD
jgi:beta-glucanase (GH16 family)